MHPTKTQIESTNEDVSFIIDGLSKFRHNRFKGVKCVITLKEVNYNWKQMEWWGFYFEYLVKKKLTPVFITEQTPFDLQGLINWDIKASVHADLRGNILLNDKDMMDSSIEENGFHGNIIGFFDPIYDYSGEFKTWHNALKGKKSKYVLERELRTSKSRVRKSEVTLKKIVLVVYGKNDLTKLEVFKQGLNSNRKPRNLKYALNLSNLHELKHYEIGV